MTTRQTTRPALGGPHPTDLSGLGKSDPVDVVARTRVVAVEALANLRRAADEQSRASDERHRAAGRAQPSSGGSAAPDP